MKKNITTNIIRCISAILVIFCHSFYIAQNSKDYLETYTKGIVNFGGLAVSILFAISGYYIMRSIDKKGIEKFIKNRVLRLIPSLFIIVVFSVFILGIFFSNLSFIKYITNINTYKYLLNIVFIPIHNLPGVFENNIYGQTVNGALWTMMVQFCCYLYIYFYFLLFSKFNKKISINEKNGYIYIVIGFLLSIAGLLVLKKLNVEILLAMIRPFMCFITGGFLYCLRKKENMKILVVSLILLLISTLINNHYSINIMLILFVPYIILYMCDHIKINNNNKVVNYILSCSYEVYLVGFPIQQALTSIFKGSMNICINFIMSTIIAIPTAILVKYLSDNLTKKLKI